MLLEMLEGEAAGEQAVDHHGRHHADGGVQDAVEGVADVGVHRGVEQQDAQHHAAGLHAAHPEDLTQENENDHAHEYQGYQQQGVAAVGVENQVHPEQSHAQQAADEGAEETVAAVKPGIFQVAAHAEDGADTGKGGAAV